MARHRVERDRTPDPRYASPIRIKVETRYGVGWARLLFVVSLAGATACGAILALIVYAGWTATEDWRPQVELHPLPTTQPTGAYDGRGFSAPDKGSRIIQQNPECWLGVPGATCDDGARTYLGER